MNVHVHQISWGQQGIVTVSWNQDEDIRDVGGRPLLLTQQMVIDADHPMFSQLVEIQDAAHDLVRDMYREWFAAVQWVEPDDDDDEDPDDEDGE